MAQAAHRWQCEQIRAIEGTADGGKSNELRAKVTDGLALSVRLGVTSKYERSRDWHRIKWLRWGWCCINKWHVAVQSRREERKSPNGEQRSDDVRRVGGLRRGRLASSLSSERLRPSLRWLGLRRPSSLSFGRRAVRQVEATSAPWRPTTLAAVQSTVLLPKTVRPSCSQPSCPRRRASTTTRNEQMAPRQLNGPIWLAHLTIQGYTIKNRGMNTWIWIEELQE